VSNGAERNRAGERAPTGAAGGGEGGNGRVSVKQDIHNRLLALFGRPDARLTTAFVLSRFRDLGDQYAPLFKSTLRAVAQHEDGYWSKR